MKQPKQKQSYPLHSLRLSNKTWQKLKDKRWKSKKSWEQFISDLVDKPVSITNN